MSVVIDPELLRAFKAATAVQGEKMSTVLSEFMRDYVAKHLPTARPAKKGGRA